jgi:hypothetical protein
MEIYIYDKRLWLREHGFLIDTRTDYGLEVRLPRNHSNVWMVFVLAQI